SILAVPQGPRMMQTHILVSQGLSQSSAVGGCNWLPLDPARQFPGQAQNGEVVRRQADNQFVEAFDLGFDRDLGIDDGQAEMSGEKTIGLQPVIELIVVVRRIQVLMPGKRTFLSEQTKECFD